MSSFRVRGKIFATVPPDQGHLHVFVDEHEAAACVAEDAAAFELLRRGKRTRGLRIHVAACPAQRVDELIAESWRRKAPARLVAGYDKDQRS